MKCVKGVSKWYYCHGMAIHVCFLKTTPFAYEIFALACMSLQASASMKHLQYVMSITPYLITMWVHNNCVRPNTLVRNNCVQPNNQAKPFENTRLPFFKQKTTLKTTEFDRKASNNPKSIVPENKHSLEHAWVLSEDS